MITEIGIVAGEIWHHLDGQKGAVPFSNILKGIQRPKELALMSLGWLAREGHVVVRQDGQEFYVSLRRS